MHWVAAALAGALTAGAAPSSEVRDDPPGSAGATVSGLSAYNELELIGFVPFDAGMRRWTMSAVERRLADRLFAEHPRLMVFDADPRLAGPAFDRAVRSVYDFFSRHSTAISRAQQATGGPDARYPLARVEYFRAGVDAMTAYAQSFEGPMTEAVELMVRKAPLLLAVRDLSTRTRPETEEARRDIEVRTQRLRDQIAAVDAAIDDACDRLTRLTSRTVFDENGSPIAADLEAASVRVLVRRGDAWEQSDEIVLDTPTVIEATYLSATAGPPPPLKISAGGAELSLTLRPVAGRARVYRTDEFIARAPSAGLDGPPPARGPTLPDPAKGGGP